jgi:hypothetical protein
MQHPAGIVAQIGAGLHEPPRMAQDKIDGMWYNVSVRIITPQGGSMDRLTVSLPEDLKRRAKAKAALEGVTLSAVIVVLLRAWLSGQSESPEEEQPGE